MTSDAASRAYDARHAHAVYILGTTVDPGDPDRRIIEPWADGVDGPILDVGSGTGRWTGHLAGLGHHIEGLEPAGRLVDIARGVHSAVRFHHASAADLPALGHRWPGLLAWYSLIHMGSDELPPALIALRAATGDDGTLLMSFLSGPRLEPMEHPVAPVWRWPVPDVTRALDRAGFEVVESRWTPPFPHAHVVARAV